MMCYVLLCIVYNALHRSCDRNLPKRAHILSFKLCKIQEIFTMTYIKGASIVHLVILGRYDWSKSTNIVEIVEYLHSVKCR